MALNPKIEWLVSPLGIERIESIAKSSERRSKDHCGKLMEKLHNLISLQGLQTDLYRFGSRVTGVSTSFSDLDIFVDIGKNKKNYQEKKK